MNKNILLASSFLSGFCLMVVELAAARVMAPRVGSSIYTWTSVIGVILLGMAIGSYLGGRWIDRHKSPKTLFYFFTVSAFFTALIPLLASFVDLLILIISPLPLLIIIMSFILFLLPAIFIGALYPALLKFYSENYETIGKYSGKLSSFWSAGSIIGTFLTGFVLIGYFGTNESLFLSATLLFINGLVFYQPKVRNISFFVVIFLVVLYVSQLWSGDANAVFAKESDYYKIRIVDWNSSLFGKTRIMFLDFDSHSIESLENKKSGTYTDIYPVFSFLKPDIKNILSIGGGSYGISKNFYDFYKNSKVDAVEIDPAVTEAAEKFFNLKSYPIKTFSQDGRVYLKTTKTKYDLIFEDAYNSFVSVPWHLLTKEFNDLAKSRLNDGGIYAVNMISALSGENSLFFQSMLKTFRETFKNYYIFHFSADLEQPQNIVLVGVNSDNSISLEIFKKEMENADFAKNFADKLFLDVPEIDKSAPILTDNFAPVEKLMSPLLNNYFSDYAKFYYNFF